MQRLKCCCLYGELLLHIACQTPLNTEPLFVVFLSQQKGVVLNNFGTLQHNVQTLVDLLTIVCYNRDQKFVTILFLGGKYKNKDKLMHCLWLLIHLELYCGILSKNVHSLYHRMKELELSHKTLLVMVDQLSGKLDQVENANVRIKGKLRDIQEDLINLVRGILLQMT